MINDVYDKIREYEQHGTFIYERFEDRPQSAHDRIREIIISQIKRVDLFNNPTHAYYRFFQEKFTDYWNETKALHENGSL